MSTTIKIGGAEHPLLFNMNSLRNIMEVAGMETFADLNLQKDLAKSMDFALSCAFYGILEGYEAQDKKTPYPTVQKLGAAIKKFEEISPALEGFTASITEFFAPAEGAKTLYLVQLGLWSSGGGLSHAGSGSALFQRRHTAWRADANIERFRPGAGGLELVCGKLQQPGELARHDRPAQQF